MTWSLVRDRDAQVAPPPPLGPTLGDPSGYIASDELLHAAGVAVRLGVPLLLTGDPGTGKSSFADYLAQHLNPARRRALRVNARSNMELRDMFYTYDDVGRFRDGDVKDPAAYLTLNGLGEAILRGSDPDRYRSLRELLLRGSDSGTQSREVVLIDEIDKAPRDVPNDMLSQLSGTSISFSAPELVAAHPEAAHVDAAGACLPIIICTSNSERVLPDAFLRRCVYFHIELPEGPDLMGIVDSRIYGEGGKHGRLIASAERLLTAVRDAKPEPEKKPGLAELLDFLLMLREHGLDEPDAALSGDAWKDFAKVTLLKTARDRERADDLLRLPEE